MRLCFVLTFCYVPRLQQTLTHKVKVIRSDRQLGYLSLKAFFLANGEMFIFVNTLISYFVSNSKTDERMFMAVVDQREREREKSNMLLLLLVVRMIS